VILVNLDSTLDLVGNLLALLALLDWFKDHQVRPLVRAALLDSLQTPLDWVHALHVLLDSFKEVLDNLRAVRARLVQARVPVGNQPVLVAR
jgi:hypothetical protein